VGGNPSRVRVIGPLAPYTSGFRAALEAQGYRRNAVADQLRLMAHASRWLADRGLGPSDLSRECIEEFLIDRRRAGYRLWLSPKGIAPLVAHLRAAGVLTPSTAPPVRSAAEALLERYRLYLVEERGLSPSTVANYVRVGSLFLRTRRRRIDLGLAELRATEAIGFVLRECPNRSAGSAKDVVCGLRSLLRYLYLEGLITAPLADAVPTVASWRLSGLPRALDPADVAALLRSCDRRSAYGRRDFAVLTVLVRLGLRAGEVAALRLEDIDWHAAELIVRGKGSKQDRLPLPTDVGEAIVAWLRARPRCDAREVFTRIRAPHRGLTPSGISSIVAAACTRAGIAVIHAHRLRHTAATEMLRAGAGLVEVGQVLRHASVLTTSIYAKVDRCRLQSLAKPWPVPMTTVAR
jgi:site-specific recombinase XerD